MLPGLMASGFQITSPESGVYNCIAWAAGDNTDWWDYSPGRYWPEWATRSPEIEALVQVFAGLGYAICDNGEKEEGYDDVAGDAFGSVHCVIAPAVLLTLSTGRPDAAAFRQFAELAI